MNNANKNVRMNIIAKTDVLWMKNKYFLKGVLLIKINVKIHVFLNVKINVKMKIYYV